MDEWHILKMNDKKKLPLFDMTSQNKLYTSNHEAGIDQAIQVHNVF
jgi:hypothetical protein